MAIACFWGFPSLRIFLIFFPIFDVLYFGMVPLLHFALLPILYHDVSHSRIWKCPNKDSKAISGVVCNLYISIDTMFHANIQSIGSVSNVHRYIFQKNLSSIHDFIQGFQYQILVVQILMFGDGFTPTNDFECGWFIPSSFPAPNRVSNQSGFSTIKIHHPFFNIFFKKSFHQNFVLGFVPLC